MENQSGIEQLSTSNWLLEHVIFILVKYRVKVELRKGYLTVDGLGRFEGELLGYETGASGELVFTTSPSGYIKSITDPSYRGQILVFSFPYIGAYEIDETGESKMPQVRGVVVNNVPASLREELSDYLKMHRIPGIEFRGTREVIDFLRINGNRIGAIGDANAAGNPYEFNLVNEVVGERYTLGNHSGNRILLVDLGVKGNIINFLKNYQITVIPYTEFEQININDFDGIIVSNGPGDPSHPGLEGFRKKLGEEIGRKPLLGICLGHQLIALSLGMRTQKMKFGHRSINHPVRDTRNGKIGITTHNHGFAVVFENNGSAEERFISLNDGSNEGIMGDNFLTVQFHPEGGPGPMDELGIFEEFRRMVNHG